MVFRLLGLIGLRLSLVHRPIRVIRRRVHRIQLQVRRLRGVDDVVVRARRNDDRIPIAHQALFLLGEDEACLALLDAEELEMEALGKALEQ
jgi:hypothetical protein